MNILHAAGWQFEALGGLGSSRDCQSYWFLNVRKLNVGLKIET